MRRTFLLLILALVGATARAGPLDGDMLSADKTAKKSLRAFLAKDRDSEPTSKFLTDAPKIEAFWRGTALKAGDRIRAIWIAEDVGYSALNESKITEASATAYKPDDDGAFALARPKEGWPAGKYRVDIYVGDKIAESLRFTIETGANVEVGHETK